MQVAEGGLATTSIHPDELQRRLAWGESFALIDARTQPTYEASGQTIEGAVRILPEDLLQRREEFPKGKSLVLFADKGRQEALARELLEAGFTDVYLVIGGFDAYLRAGGPSVPIQ